MLIAWIALGLSTVGTATAVYAAVLGRRGNRNSESALQWQKDRDQPSIRIEFTHAAQTHAGIINLNDPRPLPKYYELTVNVVNHGETVEQLRELVIETADRGERLPLELRPATEPKIEPHTRHPVAVDVAKLPKSSSGYVAVARLWRGPEITSSVEQLNPEIVKAVAEHNQRAGYGPGRSFRTGPLD